jgi:hypothetical protein
MIPYQDLAAALDRWRARQGLVTSGVPMPAAPAAPIAPPVAAAPTRTAPPVAPPAPIAVAAVAARAVPGAPPRRAVTEDPVDLADADMIDDEYDSTGGDFAMNFAAPAPLAAAPGHDGDGDADVEESTMIGSTPGPAATDAGIPAAGPDTLDADVIDEAVNPDAADDLP